MNSSASALISSSNVAENSSVWRSFGHAVMMRLIAGRKPMSSMRSASSSTSIFDRVEVDAAALHVIDQAARRGDQDVDAATQRVDLRAHADAAEDGGRRAGAGACRRCAGCRRPARRARASASGSARAACAGPWAAFCARRCSSGSANAAVLPVPVWRRPAGRGRPAPAESPRSGSAVGVV